MAIKASEIVQAVILLDQATAAVTRLFQNYKDIEGADEPALKAQLAALRQRNDARYAEIEDILAKRAAEAASTS